VYNVNVIINHVLLLVDVDYRGPSGAGKSALLHALAGRIKYNPKLSLHGNRYINGQGVSGDSMIPCAFVEQDVTFFPHMTVRETLQFRIEFEMGSIYKHNPQGRDALIEDLLKQTGLTQCADTIVGDNKIRGISGGERKRLSIAVEMIGSPSLIFLDEPTSGLDSTAATTLIQTLKDLANSGKTVVAVIHQPSQHVFAKFDDLLLLSEGKLMYYGEMHKVRAYMESKGYHALPEMGTAEHILDCISRSPLEGESEDNVTKRMDHLLRSARQGIENKADSRLRRFLPRRRGGPSASILKQFQLLLRRSLRESTRGKGLLVLKAVQQITTGFIYGGIYKLGNNQASIQDRFGLLSLIAIGSANLSMAATIRAFPKEKNIVATELSSRLYRTLPYLLAKALSELPLNSAFNALFGSIVYYLTGLSRTPGKFRRFLGILILHGMSAEAVSLFVGALSPSSDVALAFFPALLVLNIIFDGKNISEESVPRFLKWLPKIGQIRWGFEGLSVNEFDGLQFDTKGPRRGPVVSNGLDALSRFGLGKNTLSDIVRAQLMITGTCWALSWLGLTLTKQKFVTMNTPNNGNHNHNNHRHVKGAAVQ
jgi:ABC-type multidrug transport system ATPase subunit